MTNLVRHVHPPLPTGQPLAWVRNPATGLLPAHWPASNHGRWIWWRIPTSSWLFDRFDQEIQLVVDKNRFSENLFPHKSCICGHKQTLSASRIRSMPAKSSSSESSDFADETNSTNSNEFSKHQMWISFSSVWWVEIDFSTQWFRIQDIDSSESSLIYPNNRPNDCKPTISHWHCRYHRVDHKFVVLFSNFRLDLGRAANKWLLTEWPTMIDRTAIGWRPDDRRRRPQGQECWPCSSEWREASRKTKSAVHSP